MNISNKMLATLLVLAIVVSVGGAIINISQLNELVGVMPTISRVSTGAATGSVNVSLVTLAQITLIEPDVAFGSGYISTGYSTATLNSSTTRPTEWTEISTDPFNASDIQMHNTGTVNLTVTVVSSKNATDFLGWSSTRPNFTYSIFENETSSCVGNVSSVQTEFNSSSTTYAICGNLSYTDTTNSMNMSIILTIPDDLPVGNKTVALTISAVEVVD